MGLIKTAQYFIILATILTLGQVCFSQKKQLDIPADKDGNTSRWYQLHQAENKQIGLSDLRQSKENLHFRFSSEIQAIDIWTGEDDSFYGTFANFTKRVNPAEPDKFFSNKINLAPAVARQIYDLFKELEIFSIPTDDKIKGWQQGFDGTTYTVDYSTPETYSCKKYWTPSVYKDKLKEAASIDSLVNKLQALLQMRKSFGAFIDSLPLGCYQTGGITLTCRQKLKKK